MVLVKTLWTTVPRSVKHGSVHDENGQVIMVRNRLVLSI